MKYDPVHPMFSPAAAALPTAASPSHAILATALVGELGEAIPPAQRHGFYCAVGRRMAAAVSLDGVHDLAELADRVNALWQVSGWGEADVAIDHDAIWVHHRDAPAPPAGIPAKAWLDMLLAVLEGAYDAWFRGLGSGPTLRTTASWKDATIELRHGR
jgi:hypothetical protein